jgi:cellulose synthase (UDP-forming)
MFYRPPQQWIAGRSRLTRELGLTALAITVTVLACAFLIRDLLGLAAFAWSAGHVGDLLQLLVFAIIVLVLVYGNLVYQLARIGYWFRRLRHRRPPFHDLIASVWDAAPPVVVLVPSYREDLRTIRQSLLSAALQHYPNRRVVLLLDDPPDPGDPGDAAALTAAQRVPDDVMAMLRDPAMRVERGAAAFTARIEHGMVNPRDEVQRLRAVVGDVIAWFEQMATEHPSGDHTDALFVDATFRAQARLLQDRAAHLSHRVARDVVSVEVLAREYGHLRDLFQVEVTCFERKRYRNLSHEPNKAANLNSYIGLIGTRVLEVWRPDGLHLITHNGDESPDGGAVVPEATYVLTLDADSLLAPDYTLRLVGVMEQPGSEQVAVVQTPYTAVPHPPGTLERVAAATTDLQYIVHQGFTWSQATFWVGANALLRKAALDDICSETWERGFPVAKYIQDRTVIEDTESTVDLVARGWRLHNEPERLAFSATPPDFGALLIQRSRWANGGLLILPKLARYAITGPGHRTKPLELLMRLHYLASLFAGGVSLLALLLLPLEEGLGSIWLPVTAAPYFLLYWRDLLHAGYRLGDILRVYAFNVMLVPVHLAGVTKSLRQAATGKKTPFSRTPKVTGRTAAPAWAVLAEYGLFAYCLWTAAWDAASERWLHAVFSLAMALALGYALTAFVGLKASREDVVLGWRQLSQQSPWRERLRTPLGSNGNGD